MTLPIWSFRGISFYPTSGERIPPRWKRTARVNITKLVGTGLVEFNTFGHDEYKIDTPVFVPSAADAETLEGYQGTSGTLVTHLGTYTNVMLMDVAEFKVRASDHAEGSLSFARSGAV